MRGQIFCSSGTNNTKVNTTVYAKRFVTKAPYCGTIMSVSLQTPQSCWGQPSILLEVCSCDEVAFQSSSAGQQIPETLYIFSSRQGWDCRDVSIQGWELQCVWKRGGVGDIGGTPCTRETRQESFRVSLLKLCSGECACVCPRLPNFLQVKNLFYIYLLMYLLLWWLKAVIWQNPLQRFPTTQPLKTHLPLKSEDVYSTKGSAWRLFVCPMLSKKHNHNQGKWPGNVIFGENGKSCEMSFRKFHIYIYKKYIYILYIYCQLAVVSVLRLCDFAAILIF